MRFQKLVNKLNLVVRVTGLSLLLPFSFVVASSTPSSAACQPLRGGPAGTKSQIIAHSLNILVVVLCPYGTVMLTLATNIF